MRTASMRPRLSPIESRRLRSSRTLKPASTRIRVFSVVRIAAFPELPLAKTQNLTIPAPPFDSSEYTGLDQNRILILCSICRMAVHGKGPQQRNRTLVELLGSCHE